MFRPQNKSFGTAGIGDARSDYSMAKRTGQQTRRRRGVPSQGSGADYHYRNESDWLWMQELAWDMYRNDMVVGSIVDRAGEYTVQDGFVYDPQTGDRKLDKDLKEWFWDWSVDPEQCDPAGELNFAEQEQLVFRHTIVGGDIWDVPISDEGDPLVDGTVNLVEGQMCRSPTWNKNKNIVHGVEMAPGTRRRVNFHFLDAPIDPFSTITKSQLRPVPAYYRDDITNREERNAWQVAFLKRAKATRGTTAFAPLFIPCCYNDDIQFLELVRKRNAALFVFLEQRSATFDPKYLTAELKLGKDVTGESALAEVEDLNRQINEVAPGSILRSIPGSKLELNATNIPGPEHHALTELLLTFVGINLGFPLVMVLMDAKQGSYSAIRGAVSMARNGFLRNQTRLKTRHHRPYMRFKILKRAEQDRVFARAVAKSLKPNAKVNVFRHEWNTPKWESIDPIKDATAKHIRSSTMQESLRRLANEDGREFSDIYKETGQDRYAAMRYGQRLADKFNAEFGLKPGDGGFATWLNVMPLPIADRVNVQIRDNVDEGQPPQTQPTQQQQPANNGNKK